MDTDYFVCLHCGRLALRNKRLPNGQQGYCGRSACQRSRRAAWKRRKICDDPDYRRNHNDSNRAWRESHPDYWREYRQTHPDTAERNRQMTRLRRWRKTINPDTSAESAAPSSVAKVNALPSSEDGVSKEEIDISGGDFWLIPVVAKVNALRVKIVVASTDYTRCKEPLDRDPAKIRLDSAVAERCSNPSEATDVATADLSSQ